jgi:vitamin B12 transporter
MRRLSSIATVLVAALTAPRGAHADDEAPVGEETVGEETIIIVDRARTGGLGDRASADPAVRDRGRALGDAPFVSIVHPDDHAGELASLAEVLGHLVGTQVKSLGGLGSFAAISVRGAAPGHTAVLVDGVPLSRIASVTADVGAFELDGVDELELYRGTVPVELGGAGVGGALALTTRLGRGPRGERMLASVGAGSFGARHARVRAGDELWGGAARGALTAGYTGADGDYRYFDDHGTVLNQSDDAWPDRTNNHFDQLDVAARAGSTGDAQLVAGVRATWRDQGLPGSASAPTERASLVTASVLADAAISTRSGPALARHRGYLLVERQRYQDLAGEVGLGIQDRRYVSGSAGATTSWDVPMGAHRVAGALELRGDMFRDHDELSGRAKVTGDRVAAAVSVEGDVALGARVLVVPALRVDVVRTDPAINRDDPAGDPTLMNTRWDTVLSPRLTARWLAAADVAVKASAGRYARLPTVVELFGDRGFLLGTPELVPETGVSGDVGVVWAPSRALGRVDRVFLEAAVFGSLPEDTIAFETSVGGVARARNTGDARLVGLELGGALRLDRVLGLAAGYTLTDSTQENTDVNFAGKRLPRQPLHTAYARADFTTSVEGHLASVWTDAEWQSTAYLDRANLLAAPGRVLAGAGVKAEVGGGVLLGLEVKNLTDRKLASRELDPAPRPDLAHVPMALSDVAGFPLPGRAFYLTAEWSR